MTPRPSGERVRQARELRSLTQTALASTIGVTQAAIAQIESGQFMASDELAEVIARRLAMPITFFRQEPAPEFGPGSLLFRCHTSTTKRKMTESYRYSQVMLEAYGKLQQRLPAVPVKIRPAVNRTDPKLAAVETRKALGVPFNEPVPNLIGVLESHGAVVIAVPHLQSRDAFSFWANEVPVLATSPGKSGDCTRLSVSHELGHLVLHRGRSRFNVNDKDADDFAAEFLLPSAALSQELRTPVTLSSLATLKARWMVSVQALVRRSKELGVITGRQYRYLLEQVGIMGWRDKEPIEIVPEKPRALRRMAEMLFGDPVDYAALGNALCLNEEFLKEAIGFYASKADSPMRVTAGANVVSLFKRKG